MSGYVWMNGLELDRVTEFWAWWSMVLVPAFPHPLLQVASFSGLFAFDVVQFGGATFGGSLPVLKSHRVSCWERRLKWAPECV